MKNKKHTGTLITFLPDPTIFTITTEFKFERLASRLRELAFSIRASRSPSSTSAARRRRRRRSSTSTGSRNSSGSSGENKQVIHPKPVVPFDGSAIEVFVDVVLQYNDSYNDQILCFTNSIPNPDGGTHLTGFRTALTQAVNQYAKPNSL